MNKYQHELDTICYIYEHAPLDDLHEWFATLDDIWGFPETYAHPIIEEVSSLRARKEA